MVGNRRCGDVGRVDREHDEKMVDAVGLSSRDRMATPRKNASSSSSQRPQQIYDARFGLEISDRGESGWPSGSDTTSFLQTR